MPNTPVGDIQFYPSTSPDTDLTKWYNIPPPVPTDQLILQKLTEILEESKKQTTLLQTIEQILWNNDGYVDG